MSESFDFIVIGGGSAGYAAARTAREVVDNVAIIDDATELGGLCILRGCMPSKTLLYSAEVLHLAHKAARFGLEIPSAAVDMPALHRRKLHWIDDFKSYRQQQLQSDRFTLLRERARFTGPDTIRLEPSGRTLTAPAFLLATGSRVAWPAIPGLDAPGIWTSDDVLDLDFLPESVIVLGGGVVACELAQFLRRVGSRVIQIQRSQHILRDSSPAAATVVEQAFREEGIELFTGTRLLDIAAADGGFTVRFEHSGRVQSVSAAHLLNALGRRPATDGLGLEQAGVALLPGGQVRVDDVQRTSNPRVFAAGDVCGPYEIVHLAILQGEVAARAATGRATAAVDLDARTSVVFTDPQLAEAGIPMAEAQQRFGQLLVADYPFADHGKSLLMEAPAGFVRVWAEPGSGRILGADCVGKDAGELIHPLAVAIALRANAADLLKVHWYHPTLSEIWSYPLEEIAAKAG